MCPVGRVATTMNIAKHRQLTWLHNCIFSTAWLTMIHSTCLWAAHVLSICELQNKSYMRSCKTNPLTIALYLKQPPVMMTKVLLADKRIAGIQKQCLLCDMQDGLKATQWTIIYIRLRLLTNAGSFTRESGLVNPVKSNFISLILVIMDLVL